MSILSIFLCLCLCLPTVLLPQPTLAANAAVNEKPIWLVVTRPIFLEAIKALEDKRIKDGFKAIVSTLPVAEAIATLKRRPAFLLLVGDEQPGEEKQPWYVPSPRRELYRWRATQEKEFAADALLGDLDGDLVPDVPVGRIPIRTTEQLELVVNKILAFEDKQPTLDDLRLPIWAGSSGYDPLLDSMATELLLNTVQTNASPWLRPWIISADPMHPLCGWPPDQGAMFTEQLKRGGMMAVLIGHGSDSFFYAMSFDGKDIRYTAAHAKNALAAGTPAPPMVIIACSTGHFVGRENCLGESLLLMPGGPVAVIAAATESHPLTNCFSALCLIQKHPEKDKRLGSIWLAAQQKAMKTRDIAIEQMLCDVEGKLEENINIAKLRRDQILMYALLGDPATRLHLPEQLHCKIKYSADGWHWDVQKPNDATKLRASFRPEEQSLPTVVAPLKKTSALKLFHQANDTFAFRPLGEFAIDKAWEGAINEAGTLRLVATGPGQIYTIAFKLKFFDEEVTVANSRAEADILADPNKEKPTKSLHDAAMTGDVEQLQLLISSGADVNARDMMGYTPLFYAVQGGQKKAAELLIGGGANVNARDGYGNTPLHHAAVRGHYDMCEVLVSNGADVGSRNLTGGTAVAMAKDSRIAELLRKHGAKESTSAGTPGRISPLRPRPEETTRAGYVRPREITNVKSRVEVDILADPNEIRARIKAFEGLEKALTQVDRRSRYEVREWLQTRVDNRIKLATAVEMQVKIEISFIRKVAIEEKAKKTTKAIDDLLLGKQERLKTRVKTMEEETRRMRFGERGSRGTSGQRRSRLDPEERRKAWEERRGGGRLTREDTREQGGFTGTGVESPAIAPERALPGVGGKNEIQISEWLKTGVENRISLAKAVQEPIKADFIYIRKLAVEEGAKKTTAAIDGLLLSRQKRMERVVQRMEEQLKRLRRTEQGSRRIRGPRRSMLNAEQRRSGGLTPTEGTGVQEATVEEENPRRRRSRRR